MAGTLRASSSAALERSCTLRELVRFGEGADGIQRVEAYFAAGGFDPHRHDTYGIGITIDGVQAFRYRGVRRYCLPGQLHILHPDEAHDGVAATRDGFRYRIVYVAPDLIRSALDDRPLPFVANPVQDGTPTSRSVSSLLDDIDQPLSDLERTEAAVQIADMLARFSGAGDTKPVRIDLKAVAAVREYLDAHAREQTKSRTLEDLAGIDRFTIARHFRRAYGTSPDRYRTMRRLDFARVAIQDGVSLAQVAADAGFADQSHLTRQFRRAYGMTPARWMRALG